ncbi:uncharacterized protein LOC131317223 [Rhododendron vialii]|uniref:uncharacterized protein LOC131317223 n=1 Tax=Rhododendron vialii TaxID=182163 RepID=UPI00265E8C7C|nr:uncharacterized protein LOC131317223 [Rhododendron vialii]
MSSNTAPREIFNLLRQQDSSISTEIRSIYNVKAQYKKEQLRGLSPIGNLELSVNFPSVLIIDAMYKSNEYRIPLLEVVERLIWALDTLKRWMVGKGAALPSVVVSDRDLALFGAIERWNVMCENFEQYSNAIQYLWNTWLGPYKERFVAAYINQFMHLGSNLSQRAESAHARLKRYLGDSMSSLQTSFQKIEKMLTSQFGDIQGSFQKSLNIPRHIHLHEGIYSEIKGCISLQAMDLIHKPIPLSSIHPHWSTLSMHVQRHTNEGARSDRAAQFIERLNEMDFDN